MKKKQELTKKEINILVLMYKINGKIYRNLQWKTDHYIVDEFPYDIKYLNRDIINKLVYNGYLDYKNFYLTEKSWKLLKGKGLLTIND